MFLDTLIWEHLDYRINRKKVKEENIEDIYDGDVYKKIFNKSGFFCETKQNHKEKHISFQLNTDGVSLFKSSNVEIWPLYLTINELPPSMR